MTSASSLLALLVVLTALQASLAVTDKATAPNGDVLKDAAVVTNTAAEGEATTAATTLAAAEVAARKEAKDKLAAQHTSEKDAHKTHDDAIQTKMGAEADAKRTYGEDIELPEADAKKNEISKARKKTAEEKQAHDVKQELRRERRWNYTNQIREDQMSGDKVNGFTEADVLTKDPKGTDTDDAKLIAERTTYDDPKVKEARDKFQDGYYDTDNLAVTTNSHEPDPHGDINPHPFDRQTFKAYAAMVKNDKEDLHGEGQQLYRKGTLLADHLFRYQQILSKTANMYITMMQKVKKSLEMEHDSMLNNEKHRMVPMADITNTIKVMLEADDQNKAIHNLVVDPRLVKHMQLRHLNQTYVDGAAGDDSGRNDARPLTLKEGNDIIKEREQALKKLTEEVGAKPDQNGLQESLSALATVLYEKALAEQQAACGTKGGASEAFKTLRFRQVKPDEDDCESGFAGFVEWIRDIDSKNKCGGEVGLEIEGETGSTWLEKVWFPKNVYHGGSEENSLVSQQIRDAMSTAPLLERVEKEAFVKMFVLEGVPETEVVALKNQVDDCKAKVEQGAADRLREVLEQNRLAAEEAAKEEHLRLAEEAARQQE